MRLSDCEHWIGNQERLLHTAHKSEATVSFSLQSNEVAGLMNRSKIEILVLQKTGCSDGDLN